MLGHLNLHRALVLIARRHPTLEGEFELPDAEQYTAWSSQITHHTLVHENIKHLIASFLHTANPMSTVMSVTACLLSQPMPLAVSCLHEN